MNRTFKGFLRRYCAELSGVDTASLRKLCVVARENPRVVEPLFLFAAVQGKADYIVSLSKGAWFHEDYAMIAHEIDGLDSVGAFLESGAAPARYASVLDAFSAQGDALAADRRINGLLRPRIEAALESAGITRYRLCKDLGLNMGNVYAYFAGDDAKVSAEVAHSMFDYANLKASEKNHARKG